MQPKHNGDSSGPAGLTRHHLKRFFLSVLLMMCLRCENIYSQAIARLTVHRVINSIEMPVYIDLDVLTYTADSA